MSFGFEGNRVIVHRAPSPGDFGTAGTPRPWTARPSGDSFGSVPVVRAPTGRELPDSLKDHGYGVDYSRWYVDAETQQTPFCRFNVAPAAMKNYIPLGERSMFLNCLLRNVQTKTRAADVENLYHWPEPLDCWTTTPRIEYHNNIIPHDEDIWGYPAPQGATDFPTVEWEDLMTPDDPWYYSAWWKVVVPEATPPFSAMEWSADWETRDYVPDRPRFKVRTVDWPQSPSGGHPGDLPKRECWAMDVFLYQPPIFKAFSIPTSFISWGEDEVGAGYPGSWGDYAEPGTAGLIHKRQTFLKITWGGRWRLLLVPAFERSFEQLHHHIFIEADRPFGQAYLLRYTQGKWVKVREIDLEMQSLGRHNGIDEEIRITCAYVANCLALRWNQGKWIIINPNDKMSFEDADENRYEGPLGEKIPPEEGGVPGDPKYYFDDAVGPLLIHGQNLPMYAALHHVDFAPRAMGQLWANAQAPLGAAPVPRSWGYLPVNGGSITTDLEATPDEQIRVSMMLETNEDGESPAVYGVSAHWEPEWVRPDIEGATRSFSHAVVEARLTMRQPRDVATTRLTIELDRQVLEEEAAEGGYNWEDYIQHWSPVNYYEGWREAESPPYEGHHRLTGIIRDIRRGSLSYNEDNVIIEVWDWISAYTTAPAGIIDASYGPLDWAPGAREAHLAGELYYGWNAIDTIIERATGLGHLGRILPPADHYGLLFGYYERRGQMPDSSDNMPVWTPPWGSYGMDWMRTLATYDAMALFWRGTKWYYVDVDTWRNGTVPPGWDASEVPATHHVWDWVRLTADADSPRVPERVRSALQRITMEWRADANIVMIDVWGTQKGGQLYGIGKKAVDWAAIAPDAPGPRPPNFTGLETGLVVEGPEFARPAICEAVCQALAAKFFNKPPITAEVVTQGQPTWYWGDEVVLHGDQAGQDGQVVAIVSLDSTLSAREYTYETRVHCIPS